MERCHKCNKVIRKKYGTLFFGTDGKYYDYKYENGKEIPLNVPFGVKVKPVLLGLDCKFSIWDDIKQLTPNLQAPGNRS